MAARLLRTAAHSLFFMSCSVAIAPIKPDFVFTELVFFIAFAAFMAFMAFMGAMVLSGDAMTRSEGNEKDQLGEHK